MGGISLDSHLGWLVPAARADAFVELDTASKAIAESDRALAMAPDIPEARYHAARTAWHADRVWDALDHVSIYRASDPDNVDGLILHGSILGFLGQRNQAPGAYQSALALFGRALPSGDCEVLRLYAMTAARLAKWNVAFISGAKLLRHRDPTGTCTHQATSRDHRHFVDHHIIPDAFEALGEQDPAELERAANEAERLVRLAHGDVPAGAVPRARRRSRRHAGCARSVGKQPLPRLRRTSRSLSLPPTTSAGTSSGRLTSSSESDPSSIGQTGCCVSRSVRPRWASSTKLARSFAIWPTTTTRLGRSLGWRPRSSEPSTQWHERRSLGATRKLRWQALSGSDQDVARRRSLWEGRHHRTTPMLDFLPTRPLPN